METVHWLIGGSADELIKVVVLFLGDFVFVSGPQGLNRVDCFTFKFDREGNKGGVLFDNIFYLPLFGVGMGVIFKVDNDFGAPV